MCTLVTVLAKQCMQSRCYFSLSFLTHRRPDLHSFDPRIQTTTYNTSSILSSTQFSLSCIKVSTRTSRLSTMCNDISARSQWTCDYNMNRHYRSNRGLVCRQFGAIGVDKPMGCLTHLRMLHQTASRRKSESSTPKSRLHNSKLLESEDMSPVSTGEIRQFLTSNNVPFTEGFTCYITTCPRHSRRRLKLSELDQLYINTKTGYFVCHSCKKSGSWSSFKDNFHRTVEMIIQKKRVGLECSEGLTPDQYLSDEIRQASELYAAALSIESLPTEKCRQLLRELSIEVLKVDTLKDYKVKVSTDMSGLVLPVFGLDGNILGVKIATCQSITAGDVGQTRVFVKTVPRLQYVGLFGWNLLKPGQKEVILTANEFDAMAVYQNTGLVAVSLPKGDSVLPQTVLPLLEPFRKIILWFGGDMKTWDITRQFARKLSEKRSHLIRPDEAHPSALVAAQKGLDLSKILKDATSVEHKSIVTFRNLRQDVYAQLSENEQFTGVKWTRYPQLNNLLKGHRRGELTVFTGPTGAGKTTFISDYSVDLAMQGVNTLWGSFEINNVRLIKTMLTQFAQMNLVKNMNKFDEVADRFELLPMYFMTFHGQENIRKVIETMSHAVYVHDIAHVIVDNLQFMLGVDDVSSSGGGKAADRFYRQDQVIGAFRKFATHANCHVTLVIHPRKERDADDLTMSSIFGSAKVSQEADNVMILQDKRLTTLRGRKYVQIAKNRFDGELGIMLLKFDKETLSFAVKPSKDKVKDSEASLN